MRKRAIRKAGWDLQKTKNFWSRYTDEVSSRSNKPIRATATAAAQQQQQQQQQQQHIGSTEAAAQLQQIRACAYGACLSFHTRAAYIRAAIRVHMSTEEFYEVCRSTKLRSIIFLFADDRV